MELSNSKVRYALLALLKLANHYEQGFLQIDQIAAGQQIPDRYLAQLLMMLWCCGLVRSQRGAKGGYILARAPQQITLLEVVTCLEGTRKLEPQGQLGSPTPETYAIESVRQEITTAAIAVLQGYTLQDLHEKRDQYQQSNPMYYI